MESRVLASRLLAGVAFGFCLLQLFVPWQSDTGFIYGFEMGLGALAGRPLAGPALFGYLVTLIGAAAFVGAFTPRPAAVSAITGLLLSSLTTTVVVFTSSTHDPKNVAPESIWGGAPLGGLISGPVVTAIAAFMLFCAVAIISPEPEPTGGGGDLSPAYAPRGGERDLPELG